MTTWKTLKRPKRQDWLDMAIKCHAKGKSENWAMWMALLFWAQDKQDCISLGVCQGHKTPCVDCPNKV